MKRAVLVSWKSECFPENKGISQAAEQAQCFSSGPVWAQLCHSGSQQPKAEQPPHLPALQWAGGEALVQPEPISLCYCCSSAISLRENQQMCVTTKNPWNASKAPPIPSEPVPNPTLTQALCNHDWDAVKGLSPSVCAGYTIYTS